MWRRIMFLTLGAFVAFVGFVLLWWAAGAVVEVLGPRLNPPGVMVDIGGRRLHIVCAGVRRTGQPTVVFESGAFGFSADWAVVQGKLTRLGIRSCAYDRAGLGFSDPGPTPRDAIHIVEDLEMLLRRANEPGPYVLVSHSMAGLHVRLFANRNFRQVAGLVLVDSTTPEAMNDPTTREYVVGFIAGSRAAATASSLGLMQVLRGAPLANKIGLTSEAEAEKRHMFAWGPYNRAAAAEVEQWQSSAEEARQSGPLAPDLPVAVISAGLVRGRLRDVQAPPALASRHGYVDIVQGASHDNLMGPRYADSIVRGVLFVVAASGALASE